MQGLFQGGGQQPATGPYTPEMIQAARMQALGQLGMSLMAAGQPGANKAQIFAGMGQIPQDYQKSLASQYEQQQLAEEAAQQKKWDATIQSPDALRSLGYTDDQITMLQGMPRKMSEGIVADRYKQQFETKAPLKSDLVTLVAPDGKQSKSFDLANPSDVAAVHKAMQEGWTERQGAGININTGEKMTEGQRRLMTLYPAIKQAGGLAERYEGALTDATGNILSNLGDIGRALQSSEYLQGDQARLQWTSNVMYALSGAQSPEPEVRRNMGIYWPQYGDPPAVIAQKARGRQQMENALKASLGPLGETAEGVVIPQQLQSGSTVDDPAQIPEGATVSDENGKRFKKQNGKLVPVP
jgi:hypothetical protein